MSNSEHSTIFELLRDYLLDDGIILDIDIGSCLIDQYNPTLLQECPANAQQLLLPCRKTVIGYLCMQPSLLIDDFKYVAFS